MSLAAQKTPLSLKTGWFITLLAPSRMMCSQYPGGVQFRGRYHEYHGGYHDTCGGYHEYCRGYRPLLFEYHGGYHDQCGGYHEYSGVFSTVEVLK